MQLLEQVDKKLEEIGSTIAKKRANIAKLREGQREIDVSLEQIAQEMGREVIAPVIVNGNATSSGPASVGLNRLVLGQTLRNKIMEMMKPGLALRKKNLLRDFKSMSDDSTHLKRSLHEAIMSLSTDGYLHRGGDPGIFVCNGVAAAPPSGVPEATGKGVPLRKAIIKVMTIADKKGQRLHPDEVYTQLPSVGYMGTSKNLKYLVRATMPKMKELKAGRDGYFDLVS